MPHQAPPLNILQISTPNLPISNDMTYGGTERVIRDLDYCYMETGHNSMVAAPGDSNIKGRLVPTLKKSTWGSKISKNGRRETITDNTAKDEHLRMALEFILGGETIDVVHDHPGTGLIASEQYQRRIAETNIPILTTLHRAVESSPRMYQEIGRLQREGESKISVVAISEDQKRRFEGFLNVDTVIYHGLRLNDFMFRENKDDYLLSLGRIASSKGQHVAIQVAKRLRRKLVIAGEVHEPDVEYFEKEVRPHIDEDQIKFIGSLNDQEKAPWYAGASAFLMPISWDEPFGLVMIEAMASGTPVVAFDKGAVREIVDDGKTGFIIPTTDSPEQDLEAMVAATRRVHTLKPQDCRAEVEKRFTIEREAERYIKIYRTIIK